MSEQLWVAILLVISWASLPITMVIVNNSFDHDVVKPGQKAGEHH